MSRGTDWANSTLVTLILASVLAVCGTVHGSMRCEEARLKCAYRSGCGHALQHYVTGCASVLQGENCSETCQHALIALTSTDEGKELMNCECAKDDEMCRQSKQRVEICRSSVTALMNRTRVSCRLATWICDAESRCQMALSYYNRFCKSMFKGRKCTHRCRNSINILMRQDNAAKLNNCICDGTEDYDCRSIHRNMNRMCFGKMHHDYRDVKSDTDDGGGDDDDIGTSIDTGISANTGTSIHIGTNDESRRTNEISSEHDVTNTATCNRWIFNKTTLALSFVLLYLVTIQD